MEHTHTHLNIDIKPQIDYPCTWSYRVIGFSKEYVLQAIKKVFDGKADISPIEHISSHKKYIAINCSIVVQTNEERLHFFETLVQQNGIIMVI